MNRQSFVFEIGVEEIPSQYVATMADSFKDSAVKLFHELRLDYEDIKVYFTPRRFALLVSGLVEAQEQVSVTVKGPAKKIAFNEDGTASKALQGFLKKNQKTLEDVFTLSDEKAEYVAIQVVHAGGNTIEILKDGLAKLITQIYNPNPMHWGNYKIKFIRPIRWLLAMYGDQVIPTEIECAKAQNQSYGHRTLANYAITISSAENYISELREAFVIVDQNDRKNRILSQLHDIEKAHGFTVEIDDSLLDEITNIVEFPTCAVGYFDERFLALPECIIKDPLKTQQRYFPVYVDGKISNCFVYTRNGGSYYIDNVTRGNERVLRPRLEDAEFFYANDLKTTMKEKAQALRDVVFVDKGGSYADKSYRVSQIAKRFAAYVGYKETEKIEKTAEIMKADLISSVVREYTNTQGLVGAVYAEKEGYESDVCTAIKEQYLPNFHGDKLPSEALSAIMSIVDKLDSVMCLSSVGLKPAGSGDPYGLRRQVLGIFFIALEKGFDIDFDKFIQECAYLYKDNLSAENESVEEYVKFIQAFFYQRLKVFLHDEKGFSVEDLDKISVSDLNIYKSVKKAELIGRICEHQWYLDFLQIFNRIVKLIKSSKDTTKGFDNGVVDEAAAEMYGAFEKERSSIVDAIDSENYETAIKKIASVGKSINNFMENNMALCDEEGKRMNRLAFFSDFCEICGKIIQI